MDDSFRFFVEECDSLQVRFVSRSREYADLENVQGLQIMNDTTTFGGFTHSFLTAFRDEFMKLPCWTFSMLSDCIPSTLNVDDVCDLASLPLWT